MSKRNNFVFIGLHIIAWVIFVGLCVEAGGLIVNFIFSLYKPEFIQNLLKVLKPGGHIVLSVPNRNRMGPQRYSWDYPPHHLSRWSALSLRNFLEFNGYMVERLLISPITADDLISGLKSSFKTTYIEKKITMADTKKTDKKILISYIFNILFRMRMFLYKIMATAGNIFIRRKGLNIYALSRLKNTQDK